MIDLMPESCRKRLGQRSRVRRWIALYAVTVGAIGLTAGGLRMAEQSRLGDVLRLRERVQLDAGQRVEAARLQSQIDYFQTQLDRQDRLSLPVAVGDVIAAIGDVTPRTVSLSSLAVTPRQDKGGSRARATPGAKGSDKSDAPARLVLELKGVAPDDLQMATFVAGLEAHPLFRAIAVDYARKTEMRGREAREFALTCEIDLSTRYVFARGEEGGS